MRRSRPAALALLAGVALWLASCTDRPQPDWPEGSALVGRREALARLLTRLEVLEETPLGRLARAARAGLPDCALVSARAPRGGVPALAERLACHAPGGELAALERLRGARDLALALPLGGDAHAVLTLAVQPGGDVEAELSLPGDAVSGPGRLLLPGREPPGPPLLSGRGRLAHARLRPAAGLDVAALVPGGSQADRLFRLKSQLFAGAVLDGTWEAALYLPQPGRRMPDAALALGFRSRPAAVAAMERFVADLEAIWPVRRSALRVGPARGACLLELRLLPELSPCYVATERALVLGWNPASLRRALDGAPGELGTRRSGAWLDLARVREADARLGAGDGAGTRWPWRRIVAEGARRDEAVEVRFRLRVGSDA